MQAIRFTVALMLLALVSLPSSSWAEESGKVDGPVYELRIYTPQEGKLDELLTRFRDHTCDLFAKHGMTNVAYFTSLDEENRRLVYFLAYPSREARDLSWRRFKNDPVWKAAFQKSRENGPLVKSVESHFLTRTDYSPEFEVKAADQPRVFELRTYTATPGNLGHLNDRFRDHTVELFEKHGLTNIAYFDLMSDQSAAANTLIYLIAYPDVDSRQASFKAFSQDPRWKQGKKESEEKGGGPLTVKGGVQFEQLQPTDFSPVK